jgi:hypothetical protein
MGFVPITLQEFLYGKKFIHESIFMPNSIGAGHSSPPFSYLWLS